MTPLDVAPCQSVLLAAAAQRTTRLRLVPLVYLLPFHHPLRLMEEISVLDHLSGGRLEVGVGRGIAPPEHEMWGLDPGQSRPWPGGWSVIARCSRPTAAPIY